MKLRLLPLFIALFIQVSDVYAAYDEGQKDVAAGFVNDYVEVDSVDTVTHSILHPFAIYGASIAANASTSGKFAPYYVMSRDNGLTTQADGIRADLYLYRPLSTESRFSYGFGIDAAAELTKSTGYDRYTFGEGWSVRQLCPAPVILQELYGEVKYRGVFLTLGMQEYNRSLFDNDLNSGDIVMSDNARPIPQLRIGFIDFQDIPFTNGWARIQGEVAYGKFTDNSWLRSHYNYYNSFITTGAWMQYSRLYLQSNPAKPFSVIVGMQHAAQFGGTWQQWDKGELVSSRKQKLSFKSFWNAFLPSGSNASGIEGEKYKEGNHLGSWDIKLRYRFSDDSYLTAYAQLPWEDGSGIGKLNGFDGVWGLQYTFPFYRHWLRHILVEYIDFTNQSGPMHWAPGDFPGTQIPGQATGADDYYNNYMYNGWANYGMSIGSPFIKSPIYNTDGYLRFTDNRVRGFHFGARGSLSDFIEWRLLLSYRTSWGTPMIPQLRKLHDTSMRIDCRWQLPSVPALSFLAGIAFDAGKLYGNNFGGILTVNYSGEIFTRR